MASEVGVPTIFDLLFVILLLSATASILLLCRYLNTRDDDDTGHADTNDARLLARPRSAD